jgi:hypothetical protein
VQPSATPYRVQWGDFIYVIGLFHWHSGQERLIKNMTTGKLQRVEVYLVEAQTFEGLSGAPVFQREAIALRTFPQHNGGPVLPPTGAQLLGVYSGAWDGPPSEALREERGWGPQMRIPAGMGLVVPAERIVETIASDAGLRRHRADVIQAKQQAERAPETQIVDAGAGNTSTE